MILPQPESNLKTNLMVLGADIISIMGNSPFKNKYAIVDDIMNKFLNRDKDRTPDRSCIKSVGGIDNQHFIVKKVIRTDRNRAAIRLPDLFLLKKSREKAVIMS